MTDEEWLIINHEIPLKYLLSYYIYKDALRRKILSIRRKIRICQNN